MGAKVRTMLGFTHTYSEVLRSWPPADSGTAMAPLTFNMATEPDTMGWHLSKPKSVGAPYYLNINLPPDAFPTGSDGVVNPSE